MGIFGRMKAAMESPIYKSSYQKKLELMLIEKEGAVQEAYRVVDILSATAIETGDEDIGNQYPTKVRAVTEIYNKYQNLSTWGNQFTQRIINQRKALVMPYGVKLQLSDKAIREK